MKGEMPSSGQGILYPSPCLLNGVHLDPYRNKQGSASNHRAFVGSKEFAWTKSIHVVERVPSGTKQLLTKNDSYCAKLEKTRVVCLKKFLFPRDFKGAKPSKIMSISSQRNIFAN